MGASTSTEQKVSIEQREAEALAASTGALSMLQKSFSSLSDPDSNAIPLNSLQQCFSLTYKNPVCEALTVPDSFPMLLDHLGSSILDLIFISEKGGVSWVEFVRGYNKCCARMSASMSLNILLRVFAVTLQKAGSPSNLEFESDDVECKITGSLKPVGVLMLLWMCWAISWNSRTSKISKEKTDLPLPDINQIVLSAVVSCADVGSGLNVWDCQLSGLEVELPVGKFLSWVVRTVPSLPDCFSQFVYAILKNCVSHKDGLECSTSSVVENSSTMAYSSHLLSSGMAWALSLTLRGTISEEISKVCFPSETDGIDKNLLYRSSLHGRGLNRFWSNIEGYKGPLLMLFSATSGDASDSRANERKWTVGALTNQGFENKDLFYGSSGNLYAISPVFHVYLPTGKEKNFVYSHLHPTGRAYEPKPKPVGIGFGGSMGNERIFIDEDFSKVTIRHHAADKTYQPGSLFPDQGFLPVEALISEVEVWGLGGRSAKDVQDSYKKRQNPKPKIKRPKAVTMAKSMRCKREKRLRAIRREMVEPYYDKKDEAKLAAQEAALAAPKLPVRPPPKSTSAMEVITTDSTTASTSNMDVDMVGGNQRVNFLKPGGGIGKKSKRVFKVGKRRRQGKGGKVKKRHI